MTIIRRAGDRGEISGDRRWLLPIDVLTALGLVRVTNGENVDPPHLRRIIDNIGPTAFGKPRPPAGLPH